MTLSRHHHINAAASDLPAYFMPIDHCRQYAEYGLTPSGYDNVAVLSPLRVQFGIDNITAIATTVIHAQVQFIPNTDRHWPSCGIAVSRSVAAVPGPAPTARDQAISTSWRVRPCVSAPSLLFFRRTSRRCNHVRPVAPDYAAPIGCCSGMSH